MTLLGLQHSWTLLVLLYPHLRKNLPARRRCPTSSASYFEALAWTFASASARCGPCGLYKQSVRSGRLTGNKRLRVQLVEPVFTHVDGLCLLILSGNGVPLRIGVFDKLCDVLPAYGIHNIKKIVSLRKTTLWQPVGEVQHEVGGQLHLGPQSLHTDLVVVGHVDEPHFVYRHELLLISQD